MKNLFPIILLFIFLPLLKCQTLCSSPCLTFHSRPKVCENCIPGCYLDSRTNNCYKCLSKCKTCSSKLNCLSCEAGYFFHISHCYSCNQNCKTSDGCKCKTCNEGYYMHIFRCFKCSTNFMFKFT